MKQTASVEVYYIQDAGSCAEVHNHKLRSRVAWLEFGADQPLPHIGSTIEVSWYVSPEYHKCRVSDHEQTLTEVVRGRGEHALDHWRLYREGQDFGRILHCPFCGERLDA